MNYRHAVTRQDYADLASGRVLYNSPGRPALPVRLAEEVFCRCLEADPLAADRRRVALYDPCCGAAYHLTVLALLYGGKLERVIGSDVDADAIPIARRNLGLTTAEGFEKRIQKLRRMLDRYGKQSHADALASAERLRRRVHPRTPGGPLDTQVFEADALQGDTLRAHIGQGAVDVVVTDVPYGGHSEWHSTLLHGKDRDPTWMLLEALRSVLRPSGVVALICDKRHRPRHDRYERLEDFGVGKRRVAIARLVQQTE